MSNASSDLLEKLAKKIGQPNVRASFELMKTILDNPIAGKLIDKASGLRVAFVDSGFVSYFLQSFTEILGAHVANRIIKEAHISTGTHMVQIGKHMFKLEGELAFTFYFWLFSAVGWGSLKEIQFDKQKLSGTVKWEDYGDSSPKEHSGPIHVNMAGMIIGAAKETWGKDFEAEEVACVAQGKPYCEFRFSLKEGP